MQRPQNCRLQQESGKQRQKVGPLCRTVTEEAKKSEACAVLGATAGERTFQLGPVSHLQCTSRHEGHRSGSDRHLDRGAKKHAAAGQPPSGSYDREGGAVPKELRLSVVPLQRVQNL